MVTCILGAIYTFPDRNDSSVLDLATSLNCDSTHEPLVSQIATNQCDTTNSCDTERDMNILEDLFFRGFT